MTAVKDRAIGREAPADGDMIGGHSRPQGNQEAVAQDNVVGVTFASAEGDPRLVADGVIFRDNQSSIALVTDFNQ